MPPEVAQAAFGLKAGETGDPFTSPFGAHLVQVTEIREGELTLEDVREEVLTAWGEELWRSTSERLRREAKIRRRSSSPANGDYRGRGT